MERQGKSTIEERQLNNDRGKDKSIMIEGMTGKS
jgi:hypothetical protein